MIIDTFPFRDELDILECRLVELETVPGLVHVIVEADVTHGGNTPRDYVYPDHRERFAAWSERIVYVQASGLPDAPDAWSREHAQREWCWRGLEQVDAQPDDVVLHGDVDEIPSPLAAEYVRPRGFVRFRQRLCCFAVDWEHPEPWWGTVAGRVGGIESFAAMRDARCHYLPELPDAGWHLSWLGGQAAATAKYDAFCHATDLDAKWRGRLGECYDTGLHVDGTRLVGVDVDDTWPRWIKEHRCPVSWFRPR